MRKRQTLADPAVNTAAAAVSSRAARHARASTATGEFDDRHQTAPQLSRRARSRDGGLRWSADDLMVCPRLRPADGPPSAHWGCPRQMVALGSMRSTSAPSAETGWWCTPRGTTYSWTGPRVNSASSKRMVSDPASGHRRESFGVDGHELWPGSAGSGPGPVPLPSRVVISGPNRALKSRHETAPPSMCPNCLRTAGRGP